MSECGDDSVDNQDYDCVTVLGDTFIEFPLKKRTVTK